MTVMFHKSNNKENRQFQTVEIVLQQILQYGDIQRQYLDQSVHIRRDSNYLSNIQKRIIDS